MESGIFNQEWSKVSTELVQRPDDIKLWEQLVKAAESNNKNGITKSAAVEEIELLRVSYTRFLQKYPLLYNYWVKFADWEFKLGDTKKANDVYVKSLQHLSYSVELWISYLTFKITTMNYNLDEILSLFEEARSKIGYHFYAYEFYKLYLSFLENYQTETNEFKSKYYLLLRIIIEVPLYHYEYFFKKWFNLFVQIGSDDAAAAKLLPLIVPEKELKSFKGTENKQIAVLLKKTYVDAYITTQFKVYELFNFEKHISKQYFDTSIISQQQLSAWERYLDFLELRDYPRAYIISTYERCLIATAKYSKFWLRYSNYFIASKRYIRASEVLTRGVSYSAHFELLIKLIDLNLYLQNFTKARDLVLAYIQTNVSIPLPVYEKLISIERLLHPGDDDYVFGLFRELIKETSNDWFFHHILNYSLPKELKENLFHEFETSFKNSEVYNNALKKLKNRTNSQVEDKQKFDFEKDYDEEIALCL
ncbi:uncharacterized protein RJT20DRAFT_10576 [Scheffersomyces xylosifermentans]|uniref:uncharacterized protein n=1 Tax=Scheffersomyces xylosifermentans TaxID=1304137 RepID=UPI00315CAFF1